MLLHGSKWASEKTAYLQGYEQTFALLKKNTISFKAVTQFWKDSQEYRHPSLLFAHVGHERLLGKHLLVGYKVYIIWNSSLLLKLLKKLGQWAAQGSLVLVSMAAEALWLKHTPRSSTRTQQFDGNANWFLSSKEIQHNGYRLPGSERHFITHLSCWQSHHWPGITCL